MQTEPTTSAVEDEFPAGEPLDFLMALASDSATQVEALRAELAQMHAQIAAMGEKETSREAVFDALYRELQDYKDDFVSERTKPLLRALLFLHDSLLQFDEELQTRAATLDAKACADLTHQNLKFFRDQLDEALLLADVAPLPMPSSAFDPKQHKAMEAKPVALAQHGTILKVLRPGWLLKNQLLRPAEVVVGKAP